MIGEYRNHRPHCASLRCGICDFPRDHSIHNLHRPPARGNWVEHRLVRQVCDCGVVETLITGAILVLILGGVLAWLIAVVFFGR